MLILLAIYGVIDTLLPYLKSVYDLENLFPSFFSSLENFKSIVKVTLFVLVIINSIKVPWIAKLTKSEKIGLIFRSFLLASIFLTLFFVNMKNLELNKALREISPSIYIISIFIIFYGAVSSGMVFIVTIFHLPTAVESDKKNEELSMLWSLGKILNEIFDLQELGESIVALARQVGNATKVSLIIDGLNEKIIIREQMEENEVNDIFYEILKVRLNSYPKVFDISDEIISNVLIKYNIEKLLAVPLYVRGRKKGFLFLAKLQNELNFDDDEIDGIKGLSEYASLALEKAELLKASIEKERMEKELEVAREIQRKIIPTHTPNILGFDISAKFIPAFEVGGDYYDFFNLKDKHAFVIADVSGKGIEASYTMVEIKGIFEALSETDDKIENLIIRANKILLNRLNKKNFVTAIIGFIEGDEILFYRLGHNFPILISGNKIKMIKSRGFPFGFVNNKIFPKNLQPVKIKLKENESILFYTDGVNEAMNEKKIEFGYERFFNILSASNGKTAEEITTDLIKEVSLFSNKNIQNDDITVLLLKRKTIVGDKNE